MGSYWRLCLSLPEKHHLQVVISCCCCCCCLEEMFTKPFILFSDVLPWLCALRRIFQKEDCEGLFATRTTTKNVPSSTSVYLINHEHMPRRTARLYMYSDWNGQQEVSRHTRQCHVTTLCAHNYVLTYIVLHVHVHVQCSMQHHFAAT